MKNIENLTEDISFAIKKPYLSKLDIFISVSKFTIITLPTENYFLGNSVTLFQNQTDLFLTIPPWVYRNDFYYGKRRLYFGIFLLN